VEEQRKGLVESRGRETVGPVGIGDRQAERGVRDAAPMRAESYALPGRTDADDALG